MTRLARYRKIEIQVGLFALFGLAVLIFGLLWLRDFRFSKRFHAYRASFVDTGGLMPGDVVMVSGFRKGQVQSMRLLDRGVEVDLAVESDVTLRRDARAIIGSRGLLGERYVALERGKAEEALKPGEMLRGELEVGMAELMAGTGELVRSAREASDDVRKIIATMARATEDAQFARGVRDASAAATQLRQILEVNSASLHASIGNFERATESLAQISSDTRQDMAALTRDMRSAAAKVDGMLDSLRTTADKADRVAALLLKEDGTFGRMVRDPQLYHDLARVASRADSLIDDMHKHPHRYFKFSVF